jgi:hypothetical protein
LQRLHFYQALKLTDWQVEKKQFAPLTGRLMELFRKRVLTDPYPGYVAAKGDGYGDDLFGTLEQFNGEHEGVSQWR